MGPKRKDAKKQKWRPIDAPTKEPEQETAAKPAAVPPKPPNDPPPAEAPSTPPSEPTEPICDPQYRKRGITSNWSRYDEPAESEADYNRKRGEDFDLLLSTSGSASAHFRFKEQQDWQNEPAEISEFLSIDCDAIVDALQTIPVHTRLGLPEDIFPAKVIQEFRDEAAACKEKYEEFLRTGKRKADYAEDVGESLTKSLQAVLAAATKPKPKPKEDDLGSLLDSYLSLKPARIADDSSKKPEDEKSIDALLSFASRHKEERVSGHARSSVEVLPKATKQANQPSEPEKPKVDLEDWLDSVLND